MKALGLFLVILVVCSVFAEAVPAYGSTTNFNNWNEVPAQQQPARRNNQAGKRTLEGMVRQHIDDLDKQTQSDLKVLSYLEKELNKIFSCYIKLSCPRMRSSKVLAECDEIKEWPLYHQVMKMAGIRRYPYQNYAPTATRQPETTAVVPTEEMLPVIPLLRRRDGRREREMTNNDNLSDADDTGVTDEEIVNDPYYQAATRRHQSNNRRIRRDHHNH